MRLSGPSSAILGALLLGVYIVERELRAIVWRSGGGDGPT